MKPNELPDNYDFKALNFIILTGMVFSVVGMIATVIWVINLF